MDIITGIGVRNYYEKRDYDLENHSVLSLFLLGSLIAYTRAKSVR
jgi:hypothetical protein